MIAVAKMVVPIVGGTAPRNSIEVIFGIATKTLLPSVVRFAPKTNVAIPAKLKAPLPMVVTEDGIVKAKREVVLKNALIPMEVMPSFKVREVNPVRFENADSPTDVNVLASVIVLRIGKAEPILKKLFGNAVPPVTFTVVNAEAGVTGKVPPELKAPPP